MYGFFIFSTRQKLNFNALFRNSSVIATLLEITNFLFEVTYFIRNTYVKDADHEDIRFKAIYTRSCCKAAASVEYTLSID